jgi:NAD(P)-dependent dehydrogenase (short-subunit alcohol dehydrogenase family)
MRDYEGLVALVTGGSSGIGASVVRLLSSRGAQVAVLDRDGGDPGAADLSIRCDVSDPHAVDTAIATVVARFGRLDVVVNNAGIGAQGDVAANTDDEWHHVLDVNVVGMARVTRAALPYLRQSPSPAVVCTSSVVAIVGVPNRALYSASKGAVLGLALAMAADHVRDGIRVNAVLPGTADTPWVDRLLESAPDPDAARLQLRDRQPLGRLVSPDEVAHAIAYLGSPLSGSTTGTALTVDGGMSALRLPS